MKLGFFNDHNNCLASLKFVRLLFFIYRRIFIKAAGFFSISYCKGLPVTALTNTFISFSFLRLEGIEQGTPHSFPSCYNLLWNSLIKMLLFSTFLPQSRLARAY